MIKGMLIQLLLICLLPAILLAQSPGIDSADVSRLRSLSEDANTKRISDFWTADKFKQAQPIIPNMPKITSRIMENDNNSVITGTPSSIPGSAPASNSLLSRILSANGRQVQTTGRVFYQVGSSYYSCSASVIPSTSGDLIATAGHCVYNTTQKTWYNNNNWVFVPGFNNNNAPYGKWAMRRVMALQAWTNSANFNYDVAFVALSTLNGQHIQSRVGSQGIGFNMPRLAYMYSFGYPVAVDSGLILQKCEGYAKKSQYTQDNYVGQGLPCTMTGGCSGGPWLQNVDTSTGIGYVTAVNSFTVSNVANVMNGPVFDSNIDILYKSATSM